MKLRLRIGIPPVNNGSVLLLVLSTEGLLVLSLFMILAREPLLIAPVDGSMNSRVSTFFYFTFYF